MLAIPVISVPDKGNRRQVLPGGAQQTQHRRGLALQGCPAFHALDRSTSSSIGLRVSVDLCGGIWVSLLDR
ncbi:MAG TPA: hypothetical protein VKI44_03325 [Acetobacteraceae bacterium]|nr:hypothetical protein [Acetobacteraceae bacterium]